jgi:hypothetical protein
MGGRSRERVPTTSAYTPEDFTSRPRPKKRKVSKKVEVKAKAAKGKGKGKENGKAAAKDKSKERRGSVGLSSEVVEVDSELQRLLALEPNTGLDPSQPPSLPPCTLCACVCAPAFPSTHRHPSAAPRRGLHLGGPRGHVGGRCAPCAVPVPLEVP